MNLVKTFHVPVTEQGNIRRLITRFLDTAVTATGRATVYNSKVEQEAAVEAVHQAVLGIDRGLYAALMCVAGVNDYNRQRAVLHLLDLPYNPHKSHWLTLEQETAVITYLAHSLPIQRQLNLFEMLREHRVNNARTRKLILRTLLNTDNLEWKAVKYRKKMKAALTHALGEKTAGIIGAILRRWVDSLNTANGTPSIFPLRDLNIYEHKVGRYTSDDIAHTERLKHVLNFLFNGTDDNHFLFVARRDARSQLEHGRVLPPEVLEGLRSTYHPGRTPAEVLELTKKQATTGQRIAIQRSAKEKGVQVEMDPLDYDALKLYVYALETGMVPAVGNALKQKATATADSLPFRFQHVGIVVDASASAKGHDTQKWRPLASALAVRDVLVAAAEHNTTEYVGGVNRLSYDLSRPQGETDLATALVSVLMKKPESVFILTDGYENAPAGRVAEVVGHLRTFDNTPIYQVTPVLAAETFGTRQLSPLVPVLPVNQDIRSLGVGLMKLMLDTDIERGLNALLNMALGPVLLPATTEEEVLV